MFLQLWQQREASSSLALGEAAALSRRVDELTAANLVLSQRMADSRAEQEVAGHYKKVRGRGP